MVQDAPCPRPSSRPRRRLLRVRSCRDLGAARPQAVLSGGGPVVQLSLAWPWEVSTALTDAAVVPGARPSLGLLIPHGQGRTLHRALSISSSASGQP